MPDEPVVPVVETPPPDTPPPPQEALDETGVPWKNRVAEWQRKAEEAAAERDLATKLNDQYKIALGAATQQRQAPPAAAPVTDKLEELEATFTEPTRAYVRGVAQQEAQRIAEQTAYKFVSQANVQTELQADQEILKEAQAQYAALQTNPLWRNADDVLKQEHAVSAAKNVVLARRKAAATQTQTKETQFAAERGLAGAAGLPATTGGAPVKPKNKEEYIKTFMADQQNIADFRLAYGRRLDPFSPEGQKAFREAAEIAYDVGPAGMWGGKTAVATRILGEEGERQ